MYFLFTTFHQAIPKLCEFVICNVLYVNKDLYIVSDNFIIQLNDDNELSYFGQNFLESNTYFRLPSRTKTTQCQKG